MDVNAMDYEKFYKRDNDGCYTLHFANTKRLRVDEIEEIFSAYGKVISVNVTGKEQGYRFIKYKTLDETICCLKGLKNSDIIQLLPEKFKMNDSNHRSNKNNSNQLQTARMENSSQRTPATDKQVNLNSAYNGKSSEIENLTHSVKTSGNSQFDDGDNFSDTASKSSHSFKSMINAIKYDKSDSLIPNLLSSRQQNSISNSSNDIDYYKYYKTAKDGSYIVHFANKKGLGIDEIRKLFSSYGNVLSVYANGERNNGLVFVRYKSLQETIKCLKGFQNNDKITILVQKDKINGTKKIDQGNSNHGQLTEMQDSLQETNKQFNPNSNYDKKFSETDEKLTLDTTSDRNRFHSTNFLNGSLSLNHDTKSTITHSEFPMSDEEFLSFIFRQRNFTNDEVTDYDQEQQYKTKSYFFTKPDLNINVNKDVSNDKIPALISVTEVKQKEFDAVSNSSSQSEIKNILSKVMITPMQDIIVANIHANYDVHYILHLFKKYNPVSATVAETILETNIRYCHVYFKTIQDAVTVEEEFDNFDLSGENLIVLRISRLIEEAICE